MSDDYCEDLTYDLVDRLNDDVMIIEQSYADVFMGRSDDEAELVGAIEDAMYVLEAIRCNLTKVD